MIAFIRCYIFLKKAKQQVFNCQFIILFQKTIEVHDVSYVNLYTLINCMYTGELDLSVYGHEQVTSLYSDACILGMSAVAQFINGATNAPSGNSGPALPQKCITVPVHANSPHDVLNSADLGQTSIDLGVTSANHVMTSPNPVVTSATHDMTSAIHMPVGLNVTSINPSDGHLSDKDPLSGVRAQMNAVNEVHKMQNNDSSKDSQNGGYPQNNLCTNCRNPCETTLNRSSHGYSIQTPMDLKSAHKTGIKMIDKCVNTELPDDPAMPGLIDIAATNFTNINPISTSDINTNIPAEQKLEPETEEDTSQMGNFHDALEDVEPENESQCGDSEIKDISSITDDCAVPETIQEEKTRSGMVVVFKISIIIFV